MPNYFYEEQYLCTKCGNNTFKEEKIFLLNKAGNDLTKDDLGKKVICTTCGEIVQKNIK